MTTRNIETWYQSKKLFNAGGLFLIVHFKDVVYIRCNRLITMVMVFRSIFASTRGHLEDKKSFLVSEQRCIFYGHEKILFAN